MSDRGGTANRNAGRTGLRPVWRLLLVWLVAAATLLLVAGLLPGFDVGGLGRPSLRRLCSVSSTAWSGLSSSGWRCP